LRIDLRSNGKINSKEGNMSSEAFGVIYYDKN